VSVTLNDVARLAEVSKSTVSNVIRGAVHVAPGTRTRVEEAIRELGYRPNGVARALRERSTRTLGLLVPEPINAFYAQLGLGVERRAQREGFGVLIANTGCEPARERAQVEALVARRVDGVAIGGLTQGSQVHDLLLDRGIPVVLAACGASPDARLGLVDVDDEGALGEVAAHLARLGHRRVSFVRHQLAEAGAERRAEAFARAARQHGLELVPLAERPTAIVAHNDLLAVGQIDVLERAGLRVPDDVSVVGFDDIPLAAHHRIELTTVRADAVAVGERSARLLLEAIREGRHVARTELQPAHLVHRGSTAPPPGGAG
jgi:LacI family transcriptional regulator